MQDGITIEELRTLCSDRKIKWTAHIAARLQERGIEPSDVKNCIQTGEIIEQRSDDYPYPSCLILGSSKEKKCIHTVVGVGNGNIWLVTAYYPDEDKWNDGFKIRKAVR